MISMKKILCPIDHSDCSKEALKYAVSFAMKDEAKTVSATHNRHTLF